MSTLGRPRSPNTSVVPSAEIDEGNWRFMLSVKRSAAPVPSAACQNRLAAPARCEENAIRCPSGVHTGLWSVPGSNVRRVSVRRARLQIQMSFSCSRTSIATCVPSGEIRGFKYARDGAAMASSRPFRSTQTRVRALSVVDAPTTCTSVPPSETS